VGVELQWEEEKSTTKPKDNISTERKEIEDTRAGWKLSVGEEKEREGPRWASEWEE